MAKSVNRPVQWRQWLRLANELALNIGNIAWLAWRLAKYGGIQNSVSLKAKAARANGENLAAESGSLAACRRNRSAGVIII